MNGTSSESVIKNQLIKALNSSMDGIALLDAAGNYYYLNQEHIIMFGYEKEEELLGKNWQCIYNNEEIERINKDIFPILIENKQWRGETIGKSKQGMPVYQEISLTMMEDGVIICICRDIRDKQEATKNLLLHYKIMENTKSMVIITNPNQEIEWVNKSFCDISGYTLEECIGKKPGRLLQGKDSDKAVIAGIRQNILDKNPFQAELLNYKKNGNPYWIEIKGQPLFNNQGEIEHFFAIEEDITTRKESQKKLEESNLRLELALKGISAATWELNLVTGEIYYSDFLYEMTGYEAHEIKNLFGENRFFMPEDDRDNTFNEFSAFLKSTAANFEREYRIKHKKGYDIWVLNRATISEKNKNGTPRKVIGIIIDITKIKETQKKLEESENRYKKTMEASGAAIWEWNLIQDQVFVTQEFRNLFGLPDEKDFAISYKTLIKNVHPDDTEMLDNAFQNHITSKTPKLDIDYRFKKLTTGQYEWYNLKGAIIERNSDNIPLKAMGYSISIQERKMIELQLKESEERWYNAMVVSGAGFWDYDSGQDKMYFSTQMRQILGYVHTNQIPHDLAYWKQRVHPEDLELLEKSIKNINADANNTIHAEFRLLNKANQYIWISATGLFKTIEEEKVGRYSGAAYDITEKKQSELAMEKARLMAETSVKAKRRFLANVSHEIRTPMHAIMGLSEQLSFSELKPEQKALLIMITEASKSLMNIINDVLDLSKIEEGKLQLEETIFDPGYLIQQLSDLYALQASKKHIDLILNKSIKKESVYIGDQTRIRQVLSNIISNAIKFTDKGNVHLTFSINPSNEHEAILSFVCSDTGVGMSAEMKKKVFEEFVQEDESFHRKYGGSGLGLSITNEFIKLMKGSIHVESKKNKGTIVRIDIPLKIIKDNKSIPENPLNIDYVKLQKIKLLVAEDNEFNRLLLKFILDKNKITYDFAENGKIAVEKASENNYDLILMDIQMPEMDGIEATQIIRERLAMHIPIIAVTANAIKEELDYYLKMGLSGYLTKPFEERKFLEKITAFLKS